MKRFLHPLILILFLLTTACGSEQPASPTSSQPKATISATRDVRQENITTQSPFGQTPPSGPMRVVNPCAPDVADYSIAVRLDPATHILNGREVITYHNTTQKAIPDLVFHLYLNAFNSMDTVFMKESGGQLRGDRFNAQSAGWINVQSIQLIDGSALVLEPQEDGTLARAALPEPVAPGERIGVEVSFEAQLPQVFARTGWAQDAKGDPFFLVGQWFPKLGVWTEQGWNAHVFHGNAEFFADFGSYQVSITVPANYVTGASGEPVGTVKNNDDTQTINYQAAGVIDFAWVASPNLRTAIRKQGDIEIVYYYLPEHEWSVERQLNDAAISLARYGEWYGSYPYARLSVVDVPEKGRGAGGMEYPTFVTVGAGSDSRTPPTGWQDGLLITTAHEIGHQWFQSMIATDEADEPWLDEGFADYSTMRLLIAEFGLDRKKLGEKNNPYGYFNQRHNRFLQAPSLAMEAPAWQYGFSEYAIASYAKPDMALLTLEDELGEKEMSDLMRAYATRYRFAHPNASNFQQVAVQVSGQNLSWFFDGLVYKSETLDYIAKSINGDRITVERQGDLVIPTDLLVTFKDGNTQSVEWDGKDSSHTFSFKGKQVKAFDIDPTHKILVDIDWQDNEITAP